MKKTRHRDVFSNKLTLHRETLRRLDAGELRKIRGGDQVSHEDSLAIVCSIDTISAMD